MSRLLGVLNWLLVILAAATVILVLADFVLARMNRTLQADVGRRQEFISETLRVGRLREAVLREIASVAASGNDNKLREILTRQGIATGNAPAAPAGPPSQPAEPPR